MSTSELTERQAVYEAVIRQHLKEFCDPEGEDYPPEHWATDLTYLCPRWVVRMCQQLNCAIDARRIAKGFAPVSLKDVLAKDRLAKGHVDYAQKFALYCVELELQEHA